MALKYLLPGQMKFMQHNGFDVTMISADGKERNDVIKNEGCPHIIVPMTRQITPVQDIKCLIKLIKYFRAIKPDIVHTHTPKAGLLGMLAAWFCNIKVRIHTVAGLPMMVEKGFKYQLLKFIEKLTYSAATQVWPNSNSLKKYIEQHHLANPAKIFVISKGSSNGINLKRFNKSLLEEVVIAETKKSINFSIEYIYLLCVGRLVADKGVVEVVKAFIELQKENAALKLILVGDYEETLDPLPKYVLDEIKTNQAIIHIRWTDYVEYYMALAHIFIFPSHREGFPNVLLQAASMELPIICSNITGNIDIVEHNKTGLIFEPGKTDQITDAVKYALVNKDTLKTMAANLYSQVTENYNREIIWKNILEKYQSLLN